MRGLIGVLRTLFVGTTIAVLPLAAPMVVAAPARAASTCTAATGVTVVVDFTHFGGSIERGCAPSPANGLDALHQAGFGTDGTTRWGDAFVCRIDGKPGSTGSGSQACVDTPPASAYWAFWHAAPTDGRWTYSDLGALSYHPPGGSIEAWAFGAGACPGIAPNGSIQACATNPPPASQSTSPAPVAPATTPLIPPVAAHRAPPAGRAGGASATLGTTASGAAGGAAPTPAPTRPGSTPVPATTGPRSGNGTARSGATNKTEANAAPGQTTTTSAASGSKVVDRQALGRPIEDSSGGSSALPAVLTALVIAGVGGGAVLVARRRRSRRS